MGSSPTAKQEGGDPRGRNTENNERFAAKMVRKGVIDKGLPGTTRTAEKEELAEFLLHRLDNLIECGFLFRIHALEVRVGAGLLLGRVIVQLFRY